jgi:hypothetical protein
VFDHGERTTEPRRRRFDLIVSPTESHEPRIVRANVARTAGSARFQTKGRLTMRSLSTLSGPVHRIVFGTATLLGIGCLLTLAASRQTSRAVASPSDVGVSYVTYGGATYPVGNLANGDEQQATLGDHALNGGMSGPVEGPVRARCCVSSAGSCTLLAGSACPSGSTQQACPCQQAL